MPQVQILFHARRLHKETLTNRKYQETLQKIISGTHPQIEWLENAHYEGQRVGSARIDRVQQGQRLIFTYLRNAQGKRCLFILGETHHNYHQVERWLTTTGITSIGSMMVNAGMVDEHFIDVLEEQPVAAPQERPHLAFLDESQQQALAPSSSPLMFLGPAGAGKTLVLETFMGNHLHEVEADTQQASSSTDSNASVFVSQSELLLDSLKEECEAPEVRFSTWERMLANHFKDQNKIPHNEFKLWLKKYAPGEDAEQVHFELSLIVAYGDAAYLDLHGARQTYYSGNKEKQKRCIAILKAWQDHLHTTSSYDPMTSLPPPSLVKAKTYCDEGQNFPPSALAYLIEQAQAHHFYISFDPEQSLTSPFTYAFVKQRLNSKGYAKIERLLELTWRNSPEVVDVINFLMTQKHHWEGNHNKRPYAEIRSAQAPGGQVSWVTDASLNELKKHAQNASTVVIAELPEEPKARERERQEIIKRFGTHQILSASTAIGMTFKTVILWKPISLNPTVRKLLSQELIDGLTLEQWIALNAIQIALGRAQDNIFIYEPEQHFRLKGELCFGSNLPTDGVLKTAQLDDKEAWKKKINEHLAEGNRELAIELMRHQLQFTEEQVKQKLGLVEELNPPVHESKPKAKKSHPTKPKKSTPAPAVVQPSKPKATPKAAPASAPKKAAPPITPVPKANSLSPLEIIAIVKSLNAVLAEGATDDSKADLKTNLEKLLSYPQAMRYLFYASNSTNCLAMRLLLSNDEYRHILFSCLRSNNVLENLMDYPEERTAFINFLAQSEEGILFFNEYLEKTVLLETPSDKTYCSFLYKLTSSNIGQSVLNQWIENNLQLAKGISPKVLYSPHSAKTGPSTNTSPLYWFTCSSVGRKTLRLLLEINPDLITAITGKILCLALTPGPWWAHDNTSPLYWLLSSEDGQQILKLLLEKNPQLASEITGNDLCLSRTKPGPNKNLSLLYLLTNSHEGQKIFNLLLEKNPQIATEISVQTLCLALTTTAGKYANTSPLYWLILTGLKTLTLLLQKKPALIKEISGKALCLARPEEAGPEENTSPLYCLSYSSEGRKVLWLLLEKNPKLAKEINGKSLCLALTSKSSADENTSPLSCLSSSIDGQKVLHQLLEKNTKLAMEITASDLCLIYPESEGIYGNDSPFYWLSTSEIGCTILSQLFHRNPDLAKGITMESLSLKVNARTALSHFAETTYGRDLLQRLAKLNPTLAPIIEETLTIKNQVHLGLFSSPTLTVVTDENMKQGLGMMNR